MNPLLKPYFVQYYGRGVVDLVEENFIGNAKEYYDTLIQYEISYR